MKWLTKLFFAATFLLTISACDKKSCTHVVCASYETCYEGQCLCPDGYQGTNCDSLSANQYTGNWIVNENCGANTNPNFTSYPVSIYPTGSPVNYITINNLLNLGNPCSAEIYNTTPGNEGSSIYIPNQNVGGIQISNSYGSYTNQGGAIELIIVLNYNYNGINYSCQETLYKQ